MRGGRIILEKMPDSYRGEFLKKNQYVKSTPRRWTKDEEKWLSDKLEEGFSIKDIAESMDRTEVSVGIKAKRIKKRDGGYNSAHVKDKYAANCEFIKMIKPKTVLDAYCGVNSYYKTSHEELSVVTNDKDSNVEADYNMDALEFLCYQYYKKKRYDLIDLDPFGSAYDNFDLAIKMARKGLVITLGELGHKRFKRLDFVGRMYGIDNMEDFTTGRLIDEIIAIGRKNKKLLVPEIVKEWNGISRVYFSIGELKITEQWEGVD